VGITPQQFRQMQDRLSSVRAKRLPEPQFRPTARNHQVILGVDPSLRGTGYGVIRVTKPYPQTLAQGTISCPSSWEHSRCLVKIAAALREVLGRHRPHVCVVEGLFYAQNLKTALVMGEARGAR
jgi:hypothetical protein